MKIKMTGYLLAPAPLIMLPILNLKNIKPDKMNAMNLTSKEQLTSSLLALLYFAILLTVAITLTT